jgi:hypothetical protein
MMNAAGSIGTIVRLSLFICCFFENCWIQLCNKANFEADSHHLMKLDVKI